MRIIDTKSRWSVAAQSATALWFLFFVAAAGCGSKADETQGQKYAGASLRYYQRAVASYQLAIKEGKGVDALRFELGSLYYSHGAFKEAIGEFKQTKNKKAKKFLGISYYRIGEFADALEVFSKNEVVDDEYRYYWGLTCEKLNLFDQALQAYGKITGKEFVARTSDRINLIEKEISPVHIKDINPQVAALIQNAPDAGRYPQAGALVLYCDERVEITPQDTEVSYLHYVVKILNERGKENFSESAVDYDSTYEKVELEYARIIKPDGTVVEVGTRHIRDVSKYLNFPLYSNVRVHIISFPEITEGAVVEYKLKIYNNRLINKKDFVLHYPVQSSEPVLQANFTVDMPDTRPLHIKTLNAEFNTFGAALEPKIEKRDGRILYRWQFKDIPQIIPEANMPPMVEVNPALLMSSFDTWDQIYQWWWPLAKDKIHADSAIKEKVRELTGGLTTAQEKARAVYNFCAQKIRYVAVEYGEAGYEPHKAEDIFKNKYGDCKDQAILLITMLKEAGVDAWPVLIPTREYYNADAAFPAVLFNHCIAALSLDGEVVFMDPTAETCAFGDLPGGDQERQVLACKEKEFALLTTPLYPAAHNRMVQSLKIKISPDETIDAEKSVTCFGVYDQGQRYWLLYTPPELIGEALNKKIQDVSIGATLGEYHIENLATLGEPVVLQYTFKGPEYFTAAGNLRILPQLASVDTTLTAKEKRKFAIDFNILDSKENITQIEIPPQGFSVKYLPDSITEDNPWLKFSVAYTQKGTTIIYRQSAEIKKRMVLQKEFPEFKKSFEALAKKVKQRIILEKR